MTAQVVVWLVAVAVLAGLPRTGAAQGLGEVARKEEERRKTVKGDAKVYTNKDLGGTPTPAPPADPADPPPAGADAAAQEPQADAKKPADDKQVDPPRDRAYWSSRMTGLQVALDRNQTYAEALQSRINALTTDFVNRDDPAQRSRIEADRTKAIAELERLRRQIEDDKQAIDDLEEEARRAGVPAGWLR